MISARSYLVQTHCTPAAGATSATSSSPPSPAFSISGRKDEWERNNSRTPSTSDMTNSKVVAGKRKPAHSRLSPTPSPPRPTTTLTPPDTPTSPVQIPSKTKSRESPLQQKLHRHHGDRRHQTEDSRARSIHSPDAIPPSVAALLSITKIPPPKFARASRPRRAPDAQRLTVGSIIERSQESEKRLSWTLTRGPMDLLLSSPDEVDSDDVSFCDSNLGSVLSTRTVSLESMPSLAGSFSTDPISSSLDTSCASSRTGRRRSHPTRRSLEPISSPPEVVKYDPLSTPRVEIEELDFRVFEDSPTEEPSPEPRPPSQPMKSSFKSNLTASLRALRHAARSFSSLNFPSIPPEDFLTRSILTIDPQVPYTDERRPPPLGEEPTAALRRYLNPTTGARIEQSHPPVPAHAPPSRAFTASIQMQTYKVQRAPSPSPAPLPSREAPADSAGSRASAAAAGLQSEFPTVPLLPGPRQREMRENSDFIRIAVMEMAMRRRGKLDDQRPGRARWALPPRKVSARAYEVRADGVPARWVSVTA